MFDFVDFAFDNTLDLFLEIEVEGGINFKTSLINKSFPVLFDEKVFDDILAEKF